LVGAARAEDVLVHAGTLIDGLSDKPRHQVSILIHEDRISAIEDGFTTRIGFRTIDLSTKTVLPGLIDAHVHLQDIPEKAPGANLFMSTGDLYVVVLRNAYHALQSGFTSVRDVGSSADLPGISRGLSAGFLIGPRVWSSLEPMGPVGGHSDPENGLPGEITIGDRENALIRGPVDAVDKVRDHIRRGAKVIKLMPGGGVSSLNDDPNNLTMTDEEMKAAVEAAHALGVKVAAHAHGLKSINHAILAGVDSIEHGTLADAESYRLMREHGVTLVPTLSIGSWRMRILKDNPGQFSPQTRAKALAVLPLGPRNVAAAYKAGVRIAVGTDVSALQGGMPEAGEFALLVAAGLSPMDAIFAGTRNAAALIGSKDIGAVEAGRFADLIAVDGDPLRDISELQRVGFVMKGGQVLKSDGRMRPLQATTPDQ
jgi:imidazolonepropionase-like amidohydrolase